MYCVNALLKQGVVEREEGELVVVQNAHGLKAKRVDGEWQEIKKKVLVPMRKRRV